MKKNIGIIFPISRKMGIFQYALSIAEGLVNYCDDFGYTILYFGKESPKDYLKVKDISSVKFVSLDPSPNNLIGKLKMLIGVLIGKSIFTINKKNKEILEKYKIDLLITPSPLLLGFENNIPYIVPIPDIMYKYYPNFPEYHGIKNKLTFDIVFKYSAKYSRLCVADSVWGKNDIIKFFNESEKKIKVIPFLVPGYIYYYKNMSRIEAEDLLKKYNLPEKFIFYPAQFWFHKNHLRLIKSIKILQDKYKEKVNLVLVGDAMANEENYKNVMNLVKSSGIENQIFSLGYVKDQEIVALYKKTVALVFPTLLGPTNVPPIEAMILGTPILCSNLFAMPEQVGNAGLLFDPFNEKDMAEKIYQLWKDDNLRKTLIENGNNAAQKITAQDYAKKWENAIKEALYG